MRPPAPRVVCVVRASSAIVGCEVRWNNTWGQADDVAHVVLGSSVTSDVGESLCCTIAMSNDLNLAAIGSSTFLCVKDGTEHVADVFITNVLGIEVPVNFSIRSRGIGIVSCIITGVGRSTAAAKIDIIAGIVQSDGDGLLSLTRGVGQPAGTVLGGGVEEE